MDSEKIPDSAVRALLLLAPQPSSKEVRALLQFARTAPIPAIYNKILRLNKLGNKELLHFVRIMAAHPCVAELCQEDLINLKFPAQDKYIGQLAIAYFSIVDSAYDALSDSQRLDIFYRYLYLFENSICGDIALYRLFEAFLRRGLLLDFFLYKQYYLGFGFLKEFLVDFRRLGSRLVKIGYECPQVRDLVYSLLAPSAENNWLVQRWGISAAYTISEAFYLFDCIYFMDDLALRRFEAIGDIVESLERDLSVHAGASRCVNTEKTVDEGVLQKEGTPIPLGAPYNSRADGQPGHFTCRSSRVESMLAIKKAYETRIHEFNETAKLPAGISVEMLRITPMTDLRVLGNFLCKEKNSGALQAFARSFSFHKIDLLEALRVFLLSFHMPGESQIIDRVICAFISAYLAQNAFPDELFAPYKSIAYGFIVLNTMLHNPSFDKRPPFEEYLRLMKYDEESPIDRDTMRGYYNSIKESQIRFPSGWEDSYDKYVLSIRLASEHGAAGDGVASTISAVGSATGHCNACTANPAAPQPPSAPPAIDLCRDCIIRAYRHLFARSFTNYFFLEPEPFFRIGLLLGNRAACEDYLKACLLNTSRALLAHRLYMEHFAIEDTGIAEGLINLLEKTEKPRNSVLHDIKSLFNISKADLRDTSPRERAIGSVLTPFVPAIEALLETRFAGTEVCEKNARALCQQRGDSTLVRNLLLHILLNNAELLESISFLPDDIAQKVLDARPSLIDSLSDAQKLTHLVAKHSYTEDDFHRFLAIEIYDDKGFEAFCRFQREYDSFDRVVRVTGGNDQPFSIAEKYQKPLEKPRNILRLFTTSSTVLNSRLATTIHKGGCPLDSPLFMDHSKIAYMLMKCMPSDEALLNYTVRIVNCLGSSLVLLSAMFTFVYPLFAEMDPALKHPLMRILAKRLETYRKTGSACCSAFDKEPDAEQLRGIETLVKRLAADSLLSPSDAGELGKESVNEVVEL